MRLLAIILLAFFSSGFAAEEKELPTFGQQTKDTIRITAIGHSFTQPGHYHLTSKSLAAFLKEKVRLVCDRDGDKVRVWRKHGDSRQEFVHKLGDLRAGRDFTLLEGDTVVITCPII